MGTVSDRDQSAILWSTDVSPGTCRRKRRGQARGRPTEQITSVSRIASRFPAPTNLFGEPYRVPSPCLFALSRRRRERVRVRVRYRGSGQPAPGLADASSSRWRWKRTASRARGPVTAPSATPADIVLHARTALGQAAQLHLAVERLRVEGVVHPAVLADGVGLGAVEAEVVQLAQVFAARRASCPGTAPPTCGSSPPWRASGGTCARTCPATAG